MRINKNTIKKILEIDVLQKTKAQIQNEINNIIETQIGKKIDEFTDNDWETVENLKNKEYMQLKETENLIQKDILNTFKRLSKDLDIPLAITVTRFDKLLQDVRKSM